MIFNKQRNGSEELYNLTGTWYAANDFAGITHDIESAEREVGKLIGKAVYDKALAYYNSNQYSASQDTKDINNLLVRRMQLPVAYRAMALYYQRNGVSHENTGRKVKIGENEKTPWAWQLEKDDAMMRDTYYRSLDELFEFLEGSKMPEWKEAPAHKRLAESVIKTLEQFEAVYPLDGSYYMFYKLAPYMKEVQQRFVQPISGDSYKNILAGDDTPETNAARHFVALKTMLIGVQRFAIEVFPSGIAQRFIESFQGKTGRKAPSQEALSLYLAILDKQAAVAMQEFRDVLDASQAEEFPLLPPNDPRNKFFTA